MNRPVTMSRGVKRITLSEEGEYDPKRPRQMSWWPHKKVGHPRWRGRRFYFLGAWQQEKGAIIAFVSVPCLRTDRSRVRYRMLGVKLWLGSLILKPGAVDYQTIWSQHFLNIFQTIHIPRRNRLAQKMISCPDKVKENADFCPF